jgi:GNAT superfamily N-acetyltransferase
MNITYRPFLVEDKPFLIDAVLDLYHTDGTGENMNIRKIENSISFFNTHPDLGEILIITEGVEPVGYSMLTNYWSNEYGGIVVLIDELLVHHTHRGKGIGEAFLKELVQQNQRKAVMYELEVLPDNSSVIGFYKKSGFVDYKRTHLRMVL